jgi:hypothetical protein
MIALENGGTLTIKLAGAPTSVNPYFSGAYFDSTIAGGITVDAAIAPAQLSGATPVTIVAAPAAGTTRHLTSFSLTNTDTGAVTVTILFGGQVLVSYGLGVGDVLQYGKNADTFTVLTTLGAQKAASVAGALVRQTVYTTGSSATHTFLTGIRCAIVEGIAGGGGGGGATFSSPNMGFGGGGASGGYFSTMVTAGLTTSTYTVGGAGAAGANTGGTGGTGGDTVVIANSVTYTAKGGLGGVGQTGAATLAVVLGGAGVAGTNGSPLSPGAPGANAVRLSGVLGGSGGGAPSVLGGGAAGRITNGAGIAGTGYGAGGGGGAAVSASVTGGAGTAGIVIYSEYS